MKSCIVLLSLLLTVSGSWATFLSPFMPFGLHPQQQFFYPPQRNIAQEQFLLFPQLRNHFPSPHQSFNYIQPERHPFNFYNAPAAPRYPLYPNYRQSFNPVVQYIYQQTPVVSVQSNTEYGEKVPEIVLKDCNEEVQTEPEMVNREPQIQADPMMISTVPEMQVPSEIIREQPQQMMPETINKETEMQMMPETMNKETEMQMMPETMNKETEMQMMPEMINKETEMQVKSEMPVELDIISKEPAMETVPMQGELEMLNKEAEIPIEFVMISKSSKETPSEQFTKSTNLSQSEPESTELMQQKEEVSEQTTETQSDATSMEEIIPESTTLA